MILRGTAAGGEGGSEEQNAAVDEDANNSNANSAEKSSKPSSPSVKSQLADDAATTAEGQISCCNSEIRYSVHH